MGTQNSKVENVRNDELTEGNVPSTAISTPKTRAVDLDPRSPSANIVRTPIQMIQNLNNTPIVGVINSTTSGGNVDPRSPATEFIRTPIVTDATKIRNKNLDKVRQQLTDFNSPIKCNETPEKSDKIIGPKLLGVSPIIVRTEQSQKRNSYIGLLETDLDYIETNLDTVGTEHDNLIAHIEAITEEEKDILPEDIEQVNKIEDIPPENILECNEEKVVPKEFSFKALEEIGARALKIAADIETGPKMEVSIGSEDTVNITTKDELVTPIKQTLERLSQIDKEIEEVIAFSPTAVDLNPTQEFDKKIANLIYEDEDMTGRIPKNLKENTGNRTPLGDKNLNQHQRKSKHKPMSAKNHEYAVSKIPVFKEKRGKSKMMTQCENTPPRQKQSKEVTKNRKGQWDADNTLII